MVIGDLPGPAPSVQARRIASAITASSWRTCPKVKARKKVPSVEGAITRNGSTRWVAPARSRSAWSMWLAPAKMAATKVSTLRPGREPPTRSPRRTIWFTNTSSPSRTINVAGTISPASATKDGSSKVTPIRSIPRDTGLTESASLVLENCDVEHRNSSSAGGTFHGSAAYAPLEFIGEVGRWLSV